MSDIQELLLSQPAPMVVERLGRLIGNLSAGVQRVAYLAERLTRETPVAPLVRVIACAQRESVRGSAEARILVETFTMLVEQGGLDASTQAALVATALAFGEDAVVALVEKPAANDLPTAGGQDRAKRGSLAEEGETLGRRKTLARTASGDLLLKILDDPDPQVIQNVMLNPHMKEEYAVRVAARRPVSAGILDAVARSRFANASAVRRALVLNPDCPQRLAQRLVSTMTPVDLHDVVHARDLSKEVRATARRLLDSR
jgi:hypothetical protein